MTTTALPYRSLSFFYFSYFAFLGVWVPYWTLYLEQELAFNAIQIGQIMALSTLARIVGPYCWGLLSDITGKRLLSIRLGALLSLLSFALVFFSTTFYFVIGIVFVYSFFWNAILSQFEALTLNFLGDDAPRYSLIRLWGSIGFIVFVLLLGSLFDSVSLQALPWVLLALLASIFWSTLLVPNEPCVHETLHANQGSSSLAQQFFELLKQPQIYAVFIIFFLQQFSFAPYYTFFSIYLDSLQYSSTEIAWFWAVGVIAEVILFACIHRIFKRYSLVLLLQLSLIVTSFRWLLTVYWADNVMALLSLQLLHAISFAALHSIAMEWLRLSFPKALQGQAQAFYSATAYGVGGVLGALLSGYAWGYWAGGIFYSAAIAMFIAFILSLFLKDLNQKTRA